MPAASVPSSTCSAAKRWFTKPPVREKEQEPLARNGDGFHLLQSVFLPHPELVKRLDQVEWQEFRPGVQRHLIYADKETECMSVLLKYDPGASVPEHMHMGNEHIFVLQGSQKDRLGVIKAGTFIVNRTGTRHAVASEEGCVVLIVYEKPVCFL